jgi:hypothetical protein
LFSASSLPSRWRRADNSAISRFGSRLPIAHNASIVFCWIANA